jgi:hypothetical protein
MKKAKSRADDKLMAELTKEMEDVSARIRKREQGKE